MDAASPVFGREEVLAACRRHLAADGGVLLSGPAGIGKSTLVNALSSATDEVVLSASPVASEARLPYVALFDLFGGFLAAADQLLPKHLATTLRAALLHDQPTLDAGAHQLGLRIAVVELLRAIAAERPVLLTVDDAQWLDGPSAEVLAFAVRRLSGTSVRTLVAERVADHAEPRLAGLCRAPVLDVSLGGLPETDLAALLRGRLGLRLHSSAMSRVTAACGGNPLYALELGRALIRRDGTPQPDDPLPVPRRLRDLLADRLAALTPDLRPMLLTLAAGGPAPQGPQAATAVAAGVLARGPDGKLGFSHPLLSELVYADATGPQRRAAHAQIADLADDPVRQAWHRALASSEPDAHVAAALDKAAETARRRGAPGMAAELSRLAADRTPSDPAGAARRLLDAAHSDYAAGLFTETRADCERALPDADAEGRVRARLLLVDLDPDGDSAHGLLDEAARDARGHPHLAARVHLYRADVAMRAGDLPGCLTGLAQAEALAGGEPELLMQIFSIRGPIELRTDGPRAMRTLQHGARVAEGRPLTEASVYVRAHLAAAQLRQGSVSDAVRGLETLRCEVERAGRLHELGDVLHVLTAAYERAGQCRLAFATGRAGARLREDLEPSPGRAFLLRGMAELNGGTAAAAADALEAATGALETAHMTESLAYAVGLLGRARYLLGDVDAAATLYGRSRTLLDGIGYRDPALILLDGDLVEALARTGAAEQAGHVLADARARARRPDRAVIQLGLDRAEAVLKSVTGTPRTAAAFLREALGRDAGHPYPLEVARGWLTLGVIETQARRHAAARKAYSEAARRFAALGCAPWRRYTDSALAGLDRLDQPATDVEQRIFDLVCAGATNRQIANELHLSVKTVEAHLTRMYRRRGVRNRAGLITAQGRQAASAL